MATDSTTVPNHTTISGPISEEAVRFALVGSYHADLAGRSGYNLRSEAWIKHPVLLEANLADLGVREALRAAGQYAFEAMIHPDPEVAESYRKSWTRIVAALAQPKAEA